MASKSMRMRVLGVLGTLLAMAATTSAQGTFAYRKAITINQNGARPPLNDFPVMISINGDPDLITKVQSASGDDIEFKAADGVTKLDFEIDWFYQPSGTLEAWVKIPTLMPGVNTIYMDYGNAQMSSSPANPCNVWDRDYIGVWHLGESGNGTFNEFGDSSPYDNDGQGGEGDPLFVPTRVNGRIGYAQHFDNADTKYDLVDCGDDALFDVTGNQITLQAWVQHSIVPPQSHNYGILAHKGWSDGYSLWVNGNPFDCPSSALCVAFNLQGQTHALTTNGVVSAGSWHHVVATYDGATMRVYIDGVADVNTLAKTNSIAPSVSESDLWIGHGDQPKDKGWSSEWEGDIDEVRVSRVARSADWIATEYDNQSTTCTPSSAFCSVGSETPGSYGVNVTQTNYRSIGSNGAVLASTGTATSTANDSMVSFSASLPANVGKGDELTLDPLGTPEVLYILSRDTANQVTVQSPSSLSRTVTFEIRRAYTTLVSWEQDIGSGGRGGNLVADDRREVGVVYKDAAPLAGGVTISGSTTDCSHDMVLTSPKGQQHLGVAGTGAVIDNGASASPAIRILDDFVTVEWLEVTGGSGTAADAIDIGTATAGSNFSRIRYNILHDTGGDGLRVSNPNSVVNLVNNFIYETNYGVHLTSDMTNEARVNIFNNTVYGSNESGGLPSGVTSDVLQTTVHVDLRNNIAHSNTNGDFGVAPFFDRAYWCSPGCTQIANGGTVPSATEYLADPANDIPLSFVAGTEYLYLGSSQKFHGFAVHMSTQGTGNADLQWEYWNGASWADLESNGFSNYQSDFQWQGATYWADYPAGWATTSVSGSPALYYVRAHLVSGSYGTIPIESWLVPLGVHMASQNNLSGDLTANSHSLFAFGSSGIASAPLANLNFVSTTGGSENLHITAGSAAEDTAVDLSTYFTGDIDGGLRVAPWDIGADELSATTAVDLIRFEAEGFEGEVELTWETGSETDNLGFYLDRATATTGPWTRLTSSLIPGLGSAPEGARYRFVDSKVVNGTTYYYRLGDVDTAGRTKEHGPITAIPREDAAACCGDTSDDAPGVTFGEPARSRLEVTQRSARGLELTLFTEGFYVSQGTDGVRELTVPGYQTMGDDSHPSLAIYRSWVEAIAGRNVRVASIQSFDEIAFDGVTLEPAGEVDVEARRDGTVRTSRRRHGGRSIQEGYYPEQIARLVDVAIQGETKKALVEIAPLRWNGETLVLARRIVVRVSFEGQDARERTSSPGRTRAYRQRPSHENRDIVARLTASQAGLQAVRFEELVPSRRFSGNAWSSLRLSRLGETVAFHIEPKGASFGPGSTLYFVSDVDGPGVFELELGQPGASMAEIDGTPSGNILPFYWHEEHAEQNRYYQATLLDAPDRWFWDLVFSGTTKPFPIETSDVAATTPSILRVWLSGASDAPSSPDHHLRIYLNGTLVDDFELDGKTSYLAEADVPAGVVVEGENRVSIENVGDTAATYSMVMLDKISLTYPRLPKARGGPLQGRWSGAGTASVSGLDRGFVLDVTDGDPSWLTGVVSSADALRFRAEANRRYLVMGSDDVGHPGVSGVSRGHLKDENNGADYLIIGPRDFLDSARPLIEQRRRQGLRAEAVAVEEIYSEFGFGEARPEAIRDFIAYVYHRWRGPSVRYVLLLGDATYDDKDYLGTGVVNRVPALMVRTSYLWTASDPTYAAVNGDDLLPDIAIGRLPAATVREANVMVDKILAYEQAGSPAEAPVVLVADNADVAGNFPAEADRLASTLLAGANLKQIRVGTASVVDTRQSILSAFDSGAYLVSYLGHGGIHLWASENVFNIEDVASLGTRAEQPIVLTMNCLNGYFHFPYFDSLAESLVKAEAKGAIAAFSPTGLSLNDPATRYHEVFLDELFSGTHQRLGDVVLAAQTRYVDTGALPELVTIYHLLGDPALLTGSAIGN
jgi:hypothetical protein